MDSTEIIKEWEKVAESVGAKFKVPLQTMSLKMVLFYKLDIGKRTIQGFDLMGSSIKDPSFILTKIETKLKFKPPNAIISKASVFRKVLVLIFNYGQIIDSNYGKYWIKSNANGLAKLNPDLKNELFKYPDIYLESKTKKSTVSISTTKLIKTEKELLNFIEINNKIIRLLTQ